MQFLSPEKGTAPVEFDDAPIRTSNLDRFLSPTQTKQAEIIEPHLMKSMLTHGVIVLLLVLIIHKLLYLKV